MNHDQGEAIELDIHLPLTAIATIVRDLLARNTVELPSRQWLGGQARAAGLCVHATAALEALRLQLADGADLLLDPTATLTWS